MATTTPTTITYNGSTIASLFGEQTATLKCGGMKMETDLVVEVAEPDFVLQEKTATENGEVTPDEGYDGLSKVTVDVPAPVLTYYDGSVTISGGVELIDFTIGGTAYQAESGMTWADWCDSSYNTGVYYIAYGMVSAGSGRYIAKDNTFVSSTDIIVGNASYTEKVEN